MDDGERTCHPVKLHTIEPRLYLHGNDIRINMKNMSDYFDLGNSIHTKL